MVRATYIWHDCFVVETASATMVFDYWLDTDGERRQKPQFLSAVRKDLPLVVFVSHFHKDHYNPDIFGWAADFSDVRYVVSVDVWKRMRYIVSETSVYSGPKVSRDIVTVLRPGASAEVGPLHVEAYPSTDEGNSWLIRADSLRIFHAGDLNAWTWRDESDAAEVEAAMKAYSACLDEIEAGMRKSCFAEALRIDYCFFPVDSRIGSGYAEGARLFVKRFDVRRFFPMHFALGDAEERAWRMADAMRLDQYADPARGEYIGLGAPGSTYRSN